MRSRSGQTALPLAAGSRLLDLCCGHGRHSIPLAKAGYEVAGLDFSPRDLDIARAEVEKERVKIDWVEADMRDIPTGYAGKLDLGRYRSQ